MRRKQNEKIFFLFIKSSAWRMRSPLNMLRVYKKGKISSSICFRFNRIIVFLTFYNLMGQKISSHNFWEIVEGSNFNKSRILVGLKWNVRNLNCWDELFTSFINIIKTLILGIPDDEIRNFLIFHNNLLMSCIYWNELWDLWSNFDRICSVMWENWR